MPCFLPGVWGGTGEHEGGGGDGMITVGELSVRLLRVELQRQEVDSAYHLDKLDTDGGKQELRRSMT